MSFTPDFEQQQRLTETRQIAQERFNRRQRAGEAVIGGGYLLTTIAILIAAPPGHVRTVPALLCLVLLVLASRVTFDMPMGFTVPIQLAFVPLLFTMSASLILLAVPVALTAGSLPDVISGKTPASRLATRIGNSWFAVGPVAVLTIAGTTAQAASAAVLLAALAAQFAVDFLAWVARLYLTRSVTFREHMQDTWVYLIDIGLSGVGWLVGAEIANRPLAPLTLFPLLGLLAVFARERQDRLDSLLELSAAYRGTALVLGNVVEADDGYTGEHSRGVVALCLELAEALDLSAEQRRNLEFGALLHDVGKIAIPKEIINKPGKLDPAEWSIIRTHTVEGQKLLDTVGGFMHDVGLIVRSHHERWDGGGYPDGLAGEQIPLESRIISCADTWNAMQTDRSYRKALPLETAVAELRAAAGTQLDPTIVTALLAVVTPPETATAGQPPNGDRPASLVA